ncbi:MAG: hypothetical protein ABIH28_01865 [archaeon]
MVEDTYKERLTGHIKKNLKKGYTPDTLKYALIRQGYSRTLVEKAIEEAQQEIAKEVPILKAKPEIRYEEETKPDEKKPWWKFW